MTIDIELIEHKFLALPWRYHAVSFPISTVAFVIMLAGSELDFSWKNSALASFAVFFGKAGLVISNLISNREDRYRAKSLFDQNYIRTFKFSTEEAGKKFSSLQIGELFGLVILDILIGTIACCLLLLPVVVFRFLSGG